MGDTAYAKFRQNLCIFPKWGHIVKILWHFANQRILSGSPICKSGADIIGIGNTPFWGWVCGWGVWDTPSYPRYPLPLDIDSHALQRKTNTTRKLNCTHIQGWGRPVHPASFCFFTQPNVVQCHSNNLTLLWIRCLRRACCCMPWFYDFPFVLYPVLWIILLQIVPIWFGIWYFLNLIFGTF